MDWNLILNFTAAMLAIVNPIGIVPIWTELTADAKNKIRTDIAGLAVGTAVFVWLVFLVGSQYLLQFFSIDIPVFKVAGGILLFYTALSMIGGKATQLEERSEQGDNTFQLAKARFRKVIVPLVVPMLAGPGSITTVILYGSRAQGIMDYMSLSVVALASGFLLFFTFAYSHYLEKRMDSLIFTVFTRIFGIIVAAIAMQFVLEGLGEVFPNWLEGQSTFDNPDSNGASGNTQK
ncbi:MarC family protein [Catalinimonas niigatensis]|uniref:MarC family protein n=1 Tax=Catalinimonas niigatensis TaxID=1397264 RepID=UPI002665B66A|nr:MarC family protein [Catalinimonas niigatensis]WPP50195.1 MarC family protein [Catalinimonas niigatensis]